MYKSEEIANRIKTLAKQKNIQIKTMLENCDLSKNTLSSMLSGGSTPKSDNLAKIADQLKCSIDYLLGRTDNPELPTVTRTVTAHKEKASTPETENERTLLQKFNKLNTQGRQKALAYMDDLLQADTYRSAQDMRASHPHSLENYLQRNLPVSQYGEAPLTNQDNLLSKVLREPAEEQFAAQPVMRPKVKKDD